MRMVPSSFCTRFAPANSNSRDPHFPHSKALLGSLEHRGLITSSDEEVVNVTSCDANKALVLVHEDVEAPIEVKLFPARLD